MRKIGFLLIAIGLVWAAFAFNRDTTVSAGGYFGVPAERVHNIGLMEDRRNETILAGVVFLAGILLVGFGSLRPEEMKLGQHGDKLEMDRLGIQLVDGKYVFGDYRYDTLGQAVIHAKAAGKSA